MSHPDRVLGCCQCSIHEDAIHTLLHGETRIGRSSYPCVYDDWDFKPPLDLPNEVGVHHTKSTADWTCKRHNRDTTRIFKSECGNEIIVGICHYLEPFIGKSLRRFDRSPNVR